MKSREELRAERRRIEDDYRAAYHALNEHYVLYGDVDGPDPVGIFDGAQQSEPLQFFPSSSCTLCDIALDATNRDPTYPHLCRACNADVDEAGAALPDEFPNDDDRCDFDDEVVT